MSRKSNSESAIQTSSPVATSMPRTSSAVATISRPSDRVICSTSVGRNRCQRGERVPRSSATIPGFWPRSQRVDTKTPDASTTDDAPGRGIGNDHVCSPVFGSNSASCDASPAAHSPSVSACTKLASASDAGKVTGVAETTLVVGDDESGAESDEEREDGSVEAQAATSRANVAPHAAKRQRLPMCDSLELAGANLLEG